MIKAKMVINEDSSHDVIITSGWFLFLTCVCLIFDFHFRVRLGKRFVKTFFSYHLLTSFLLVGCPGQTLAKEFQSFGQLGKQIAVPATRLPLYFVIHYLPHRKIELSICCTGVHSCCCTKIRVTTCSSG